MKAKEKDVFTIGEADKSLKELNKISGEQIKQGKNNSFETQLLNSIKQKSNILRENPFYGNPISKKLIPKELIKKYKIGNLWRIELTNFWRMLYTIKGDEIEVICFILEICDHKKYNKLFGYRNK
jgi:hypothetical protein